jgi:UDP-3-O-[3-hydroxymyristoyl] glucosamine N-acyltransferase
MSKALLTHADPRTVWNTDAQIVEVDGIRYRVHEKGGGLVALTATVGADVFVAPGATVRDFAVVIGMARLFDESTVEGHAVVADYCTLHDQARVGQNATLRGSVTMAGKSCADGTARLSGGVQLRYLAHVSDGVYTGGISIA